MTISTPAVWNVDRIMNYDPLPQLLHPSASGVNLTLSGTLAVTGTSTFTGVVSAVSVDIAFGLVVGSGAGSTIVNGTINVSNGSTGQLLGYDGTTWSGLRIGGSAVALALSGTDILTLSPTGTNHLRPNTDNSVNLGIASTNRYKFIFGMGLSIGGTDTPLAGQIKLGISGGAGYLSYYDGSYITGHIDASELLLEISGTEALKIQSTGHVRIKNNKLFKSLNAAGNADLDLIGRNASDALIIGNGLTGLLKASSSVVTAATLVNADVSNSADISPTKIKSHEFLAFVNATTSNDKTGDGTGYTVLFNGEVFDDSAAYNPTTGIYTAPETGVYQFNVIVDCANLGAGHTSGFLNFVTSNRAIRGQQINIAAMRDSGNVAAMVMTVMCDMDINDTAYMQLFVSNSTKTVGVVGNAGIAVSHISGGMVA